jgi:hypothetical protein
MKLLEIIKGNPKQLNEGTFSSLMNKSFGTGFKATVAAGIETTLNKIVDDLAKASGKVSLRSVKNSAGYIDALKKSINEASMVKHGKKFSELTKSEADILAKNVQDGMDAHLLDYSKKTGKLADADLAAARQAVDQTSDAVKAGTATPRDLTAATKNLVANQKMAARVENMKKVLGGFDQRTRTQIINLLKKDIKPIVDTGEKISQQVAGETTIYSGGKLLKISKEQLKAFPGQVKRVIVNRPVLSTLVAMGLTAAVLYLIFGDGTILTDENGKPIDDNGNINDWVPCVQELLRSGEGKVVFSDSGQMSVLVMSSEYPKGIKFYTNGRVLDIGGQRMGKYKCKQGLVTIAEQSDVETLGREVRKGALVDSDEQIIVDTIIKNAQTKQSFENFLGQYKQKYGVDLATNIGGTISPYHDQEQWLKLQNHLQKIGITFGWDGKKGHPTFTGATANSSSGNKVGLGNIEITWDTPGSGSVDDGGVVTAPPRKSNYHDCSNKDFPYEFGCIAPKIAEIQVCLNVRPQRGYFGPKTLAALKEKGFIDSSNTITKETYDKVSAICNKGSEENVGNTRVKENPIDIKPREIKMPTLSGDLVKLPNIQPTDAMNGQKIYEALSSNYGDGTNPQYPYIFVSGGRIKYKGDGLPQEALNALNQYIGALGYVFMKQKEKEDYEMKYVWVKE